MSPEGAVAEPAAAAGAPVDVILKDGGTLRLRAPGADDADALVDFFARLSGRSLYLRFHGLQPVDRRLVETYLAPDWVERGALVGTLAREGGPERIVALASYTRLRDPSAAEVAFAVSDEEQGRGIGTRLLEQLALRAGGLGMTRFVADVLAENRPMLVVFEDAGFELERRLEGGELDLRFPIAATESLRTRVAERDHVAVTASLRPFFQPRSVAVIGASAREGSIGGDLFRNILRGGFQGSAYPVNKTGTPVQSVRAYRTMAEIGEPVDLAVVCVPGAAVLEAVEAALASGVRALCVISAGFAEAGAEGIERQETLLALARSHGARLVGPNCLGIAVSGSRLEATFAARPLPPGHIGFSSQSGALGLALLEAASGRGLGFSSFVSIGNKADVSSNDLLEWWDDDEDTDLVLLYLESFGNPRTFARLAHRVARHKPILALKAGSTGAGAKAASSHTAALATSDRVVDALFHQAGVLRARTLEELIDAAALLSSQPLPHGKRVGVVTNAGGLGILCADACDAHGLELPELAAETRAALEQLLPAEASVANPVDMLGSATAAAYEAVIPPLLADPGIDALIVLFVPPIVAGAEDVAEAIRRAADSSSSGKPVLASVLSAEGTPDALRRGSVAALPYPESAARALAFAAQRAEWLRRPHGTIPELADVDTLGARRIVDAALLEADDSFLDASEARALLQAYGIPLVKQRVAATVEEAVAAAEALGFPAVVKTAAPGVHKTDVGGVALDLRTELQVRLAVEKIGTPVLVEQYLAGGVELLAGVVQDPVFGPLVAFGPGGVLAELIGETRFAIAPLTDVDAEELVANGKAARLIGGFRGAPAADPQVLCDLLHRLSRLALDFPEVAELDLNPVLAFSRACVAVDTRVRLRAHTAGRPLKSW
jgi:acetyl coenzyme A synthetase (ADP forming)-like protein